MKRPLQMETRKRLLLLSQLPLRSSKLVSRKRHLRPRSTGSATHTHNLLLSVPSSNLLKSNWPLMIANSWTWRSQRTSLRLCATTTAKIYKRMETMLSTLKRQRGLLSYRLFRKLSTGSTERAKTLLLKNTKRESLRSKRLESQPKNATFSTPQLLIASRDLKSWLLTALLKLKRSLTWLTSSAKQWSTKFRLGATWWLPWGKRSTRSRSTWIQQQHWLMLTKKLIFWPPRPKQFSRHLLLKLKSLKKMKWRQSPSKQRLKVTKSSQVKRSLKRTKKWIEK